MRQKFIPLSWVDSNDVLHSETLKPYDLIAYQGEEFLLAKTKDNNDIKIRLDHIMQDQQSQPDI
jgi:hypothetical protein